MNRFLPNRKLSISEIVLIPEAVIYLLIFRLKVSFQASRKWMPKVTTAPCSKLGAEKLGTALLVAKVINGLETRTPWKSTCLVKALTANKMLQRRQIDHKIRIGVTPILNSQFEAHAWVSVENEVIIGGNNLENFTQIAQLR